MPAGDGLADQSPEPVRADEQAGVGPHLIGGRYRLNASIGRGAMGTVWRAWDELLRRDVAVKEILLPAALTPDEQHKLYQRTLREARSAARLSHRAVSAVYDVIQERGHPWIVMELVDGRSLDRVIKRSGPMAPKRAAEIGRELLSALRAAHSAGVLHRDVKPANVLLTRDGGAVLTDFGIAVIDGDPEITQTGFVIGTPAYMAPERVRNNAATPAADLWSLGATLYAAVEGKGPYEDHGTCAATMAAILTQDPAPPANAGPLAGAITALLRRDPATRPSAAATMRLLETAAKTASRARSHRHHNPLPGLLLRRAKSDKRAKRASSRTAAMAAVIASLVIAVPASLWALHDGTGRAPASQATQPPHATKPPHAPIRKPSAARLRRPASKRAPMPSSPPGLHPPAPGADELSAGAGLTVIAAEGPQDSLDLYYTNPSGSWQMQVINGPDSTYSTPTVSVSPAGPGGETDIAAEGPGNSLLYYSGQPGRAFKSVTVAGSGSTYSAPAMFVRAADPAGEADIAAEGPGNSLFYYFAKPGSPFESLTVAGAGSTYSAPAMFVRAADPAGEADIAAEGPGNSLLYYFAEPGSPFSADTVAGAGTTYSAPAIFVRATGEADIAAEGPGDSLRYYTNMPGASFNSYTVAGAGSAYWPPALAVTTTRSPGHAEIAAEDASGDLDYYTAAPGIQSFTPVRIAGSG
jgi:eukaryotic-like serine/threonine-protein kinase